jgi:ubiquinone/menaquinone biosynthesis C-methylase UbiE
MLAAELGARVIGLDPSEKMIDQARRKPATSPVVFGRASAHELPLREGCVDLVFMSQIYHHLADQAAVARECRRVLRAGGYLCIRTPQCAMAQFGSAASAFSKQATASSWW